MQIGYSRSLPRQSWIIVVQMLLLFTGKQNVLMAFASPMNNMNQRIIYYKLPEESPRGTLVGDVLKDFIKLLNVQVQINNAGQPTSIDFTITNRRDRAAQLFTLDRKKGHLRVSMSPDREKLCPNSGTRDFDVNSQDSSYLNEIHVMGVGSNYGDEKRTYIQGSIAPYMPCSIDIKVAFRLEEPSTSESSITQNDPGLFTIRVEIEDINDHAPVFPQARFTSDLGELSSVPKTTTIDLPTAYDPDAGSNGTIVYWLEYASSFRTPGMAPSYAAGGQQRPFALHGDPLRLILTDQLDWESVKEYSLIVYAQDYGLPNPRVGKLNVQINVQDENDIVPEFEKSEYSVWINESILRGTTILELTATDGDSSSNGQLTFSLAQPLSAKERLSMQYFGIRTVAFNRAAIFVIQAPDVDAARTWTTAPTRSTHTISQFPKSLPDSRHSEFEFHIIVRDNGYPRQLSSRAKVTVRVMDVNDIIPSIFISYLSASQPDDKVEGNVGFGPSSLTLERNHGVVLENVDRAFIAFVTVQDYDSGASGQVQCHTTNDAFSLIPVGQSSYLSGAERTNLMDNFDRLQSLTSAQIASGEIGYKLFATEAFDREKTSEITFNIICVDNPTTNKADYFEHLNTVPIQNIGGRTNTLQLTGSTLVRVFVVDANDNPPVFQRDQYTYSMDEADGSIDANPSTDTFNLIGKVTASDKDYTSQLIYSLQGPESDAFSIEEKTGKLYAKRLFDREQVLQDTQSGKNLDPTQLKTLIEADAVYLLLKVMASDGLHNVSTNVKILIRDINDNMPIFTQSNYVFTVQENEQPVQSGTIGTVSATDSDHGPNAQIRYQISDLSAGSSKHTFNHANASNQRFQLPSRSHFTISTRSGQIHLIRRLDREQQAHHIFYIMASDNQEDRYIPDRSGSSRISHTATTTVTIIVADVNDNTPRITYPPPHGVVNVESGAPAGHNLFTVVAEDPDAGENGTVRFTLTLATFERSREKPRSNRNDGQDATEVVKEQKPVREKSEKAELFSIDPTTGIVFVGEKLVDRSANYLLVIGAHDLGRPKQRKVTSTVTVRVQDSRLIQALSSHQANQADDSPYTKELLDKPMYSKDPEESFADYNSRIRGALGQQTVNNLAVLQKLDGDGSQLKNSGNFRGRLASLTDRTVVVILATIFALLLLTTVVLILLIKRRRDQEQQRREEQKANLEYAANHRHGPHISSIPFQDGKYDEAEVHMLEYDPTMYGRRPLSSNEALNSCASDYQQVTSKLFFSPTLPTSFGTLKPKKVNGGDQAQFIPINLSNSVEMLALTGTIRKAHMPTRTDPTEQVSHPSQVFRIPSTEPEPDQQHRQAHPDRQTKDGNSGTINHHQMHHNDAAESRHYQTIDSFLARPSEASLLPGKRPQYL